MNRRVLAAVAMVSLASGSVQARPVWTGNGSAAPLVSYDVVTAGSATTGEQIAAGRVLATFAARPTAAVALGASLDPAIATEVAVRADFPFVPGRVLLAMDGHKGLYCDFMRNRGLGSSVACLRDGDGDGRFDRALRFDFNSAGADLVFITSEQKLRGGHLKADVALAVPLAYAPTALPAEATAPIKLVWQRVPAKRTADGEPAIDLYLTDASQLTGTDVLSQTVVRVRAAGLPITVPAFGTGVALLGFEANGGLRYRVTAGASPTRVGVVFRGYVVHIIGY